MRDRSRAAKLGHERARSRAANRRAVLELRKMNADALQIHDGLGQLYREFTLAGTLKLLRAKFPGYFGK